MTLGYTSNEDLPAQELRSAEPFADAKTRPRPDCLDTHSLDSVSNPWEQAGYSVLC